MVISKNSQLGLRFSENTTKVDFLTLHKEYIEKELGLTHEAIESLTNIVNNLDNIKSLSEKDIQFLEKEKFDFENNKIPSLGSSKIIRDKVTEKIGMDLDGEASLLGNSSKYFFICESVYKAAELIKVNTGFTGRILKDIESGSYTYLMGINRMVRFIVKSNALRGIYYNDKDRIAFEFGCDLETGEYFSQKGYDSLFTMIMQVLSFVELGDIEVKELEGGRNNGSKKKENKITNTTNNTVYVVDSSWNQIIVRTTGFAVRGHFRLQPCGSGMIDRKLIWIAAFEKDGYKRKPKASILK